MCLTTTKRKALSMIFSLLVVALSTLASLYYKLSGYAQLFMIMLLAVTLLIPFFSKSKSAKIICVPKITVLLFLMAICVLHNNSRLKAINTATTVILFITSIFMVWLSKYQDKDWLGNALLFSKGVYMFYALYTIGMYFMPQLFRITLMLFPSNMLVLTQQYSQGCMPGFTNHYSTNGMLVGMAVVLWGCVMFFNGNRKTYKIWFAISLIALLLTGKRAHILFSCAALFFAYYAYMSNRRKTRLVRTFGILIGVLVGVYIIANYIPALAVFMTRFADTAESGDNTLGRTQMWAIAFDLFLDNPLFGIGWGQFIHRNIHEWNAHNIYVQLLCETGIIGFTFFVCFFVYSLFSAWKAMIRIRKYGRHDDSGALYLMISIAVQFFFLMYGFTGNPLYDKEMYLPYFIACTIPGWIRQNCAMDNELKGD